MAELEKSDISSAGAVSSWTDMVCRDCGRCVRVCPAGIDIPSLLAMEERIHAGEDEKRAAAEWEENRRQHGGTGQPIDCIECGICSRRCPQGFALLAIVRKYAMKQSGELAEENFMTAGNM